MAVRSELTSRYFGLVVGVQRGGDVVPWDVGVDAANGCAQLSQVHFAQDDAICLLVGVNQGGTEGWPVSCISQVGPLVLLCHD